MITKKQAYIALITGLTAFSLSYHQAWAGTDPGEQATEEVIFSEGMPEAPGTQLLASDVQQDLTAFVEQNIGSIEDALLASESAQHGEALLAYNENSGEWEEVLLSALTETGYAVSYNKVFFVAATVSAFTSTFAGLSTMAIMLTPSGLKKLGVVPLASSGIVFAALGGGTAYVVGHHFLSN